MYHFQNYNNLTIYCRSYRKKCQGRLRKHLADLCLQAGVAGDAILHYETAIDILRPVNDWLWIGGKLNFFPMIYRCRYFVISLFKVYFYGA